MQTVWVRYDLSYTETTASVWVDSYTVTIKGYTVPVYVPYADPIFLPDTPEEFIKPGRGAFFDASSFSFIAYTVEDYYDSYLNLTAIAAEVSLAQPTEIAPNLINVTRTGSYNGNQTEISFSFYDHVWRQSVVNQDINTVPLQAYYFGSVTYDAHSAAGSVYALYDGLLGRAPDPIGLASWVGSIKAGIGLHDVAAAFLASSEAQARIGAADNSSFLEQLYQANLHRASDPDGMAGWTDKLNHGTLRADVALGFALSDEHIASLKSVYDAGIFVPDQDASNVARLYYGILDRAPDANGLQGWTSSVKAGTTLHDVAAAYLGSAEYEVHSTGLTDAQFVDSMYNQILGRRGDTSGVQAWNNYLDHAGARGTVIDGFTDSLEFQGKYAGQSSAAYVERLYEHVLGRNGDASGLQGWASALDTHTMSRTDVAHAFTGSAEFQAKYVGPSDATFIDSLYENALGRHADASGLQAWTRALAHGTSRADVAVAIAESTEAQQHLVGQIEAGWHLA